jgi:hypothetical protein
MPARTFDNYRRTHRTVYRPYKPYKPCLLRAKEAELGRATQTEDRRREEWRGRRAVGDQIGFSSSSRARAPAVNLNGRSVRPDVMQWRANSGVQCTNRT